MVPAFDTFNRSARVAFAETMCYEPDDKALTAFDAKGPSFDFYIDGNVDSLDMLDINFCIEKKLGIRIDLEGLMDSGKPMTLQNLYNSIRT